MKKSLIKRLILWILFIPLVLLSLAVVLAYLNQDKIVQSQVEALNSEYRGKILIGDTHLAPFENFPKISLKVDDVQVFEEKTEDSAIIVDVADIYIGFRIWDILSGNFDIQTLLIEDGFIDYIVHPDGKSNLENALSFVNEEEDHDETPINVHLKKIELRNVAAHHLQEATNNQQEFLIREAFGGFKSNQKELAVHVDTEFELNVLVNGDTTYFRHKHFELHTDLTLDEESGILVFQPSQIIMEHGNFQLEGIVDTRNDMDLDLKVKGTKPSFDLFMAFAPEEVAPILQRYENAGKIYFNLDLKGPTTDARQPFFDASFGASEAYLENPKMRKRVDEMGFSGHFTNGSDRNLQSMEFSMKNIRANLEKGKFVGNILVKNFEAPEIDMELDADFEIPFLADFLNLEDISDTKGTVEMKLKFHDIIDIDNPQKALKDLNQAYFAELKIENLAFKSEQFPASLKDLDVHLEMKGKEAELDQLDLVFGNSSLSVSGWLSDLPAIVHDQNTPVEAHLDIASELLDIAELSGYSEKDSTGMNEQIKNLKMGFSFKALGDAFTEFQHLPKGEFFIDDLYADLQNYPHTLHDFHADVLINDDDLSIVDFVGEIDDSDFHFNGLIHDYSYWMQEEMNGDVGLDITLRSDLLRFEDLFSYRNENYIPEDYRHEEVEKLVLHMDSKLHYAENEFSGIDLKLDKLEGKMHVHPLRFENFRGDISFRDEHLMLKELSGKMGRTDFSVNMNYYLGEDESIKLRDNLFEIKSNFIDFDALTNFEERSSSEDRLDVQKEESKDDVTEHAEAYNIYELPFTDMEFRADVGHFIYHRLDLQNVQAKMRTTHDHIVYLDTISLDAAGGHIALNGILNGSDPENIFIEPNMRVTNVDLDKILFKFENFGQDAIVSENLHGQITADITGRIRIHPDFVPDLDKSEVHLDAQVLNGRLENYEPMMLLTDYFGDKDLSNVRFDTLRNHMDITNGKITIPNMTIESTLGHMDISGTQDMNDSIDYYARIPWSVVKKATRNKIFGAKKDSTLEDEIVEVDRDKKTRYLNVNVTGTIEDFKVKLGKAKK